MLQRILGKNSFLQRCNDCPDWNRAKFFIIEPEQAFADLSHDFAWLVSLSNHWILLRYARALIHRYSKIKLFWKFWEWQKNVYVLQYHVGGWCRCCGFQRKYFHQNMAILYWYFYINVSPIFFIRSPTQVFLQCYWKFSMKT